jgi:hypothetical protein
MFNNKKDPLVDAVKKIMEQNEKEREALKSVNEAFGVHSKKALPHELHGKYDAMLEEAKKCMYEEDDDKELSPKQKKLAAKAGDKDEIEAADLAKLRKDKTLEEAKATEAQKEKVAKVMHKWKKGKEHIGKSDKTVPVTKKGQKQAVAIALSQAGLSKKKMDESFDSLNEEIRNNLLEKLNSVYETYGEQAAQYAYDTLSEEERGILSEVFGNTENMTWRQSFRARVLGKYGEGSRPQPADGNDPSNPTKAPTTYNYGATSKNYGAFGDPKTTPTRPTSLGQMGITPNLGVRPNNPSAPTSTQNSLGASANSAKSTPGMLDVPSNVTPRPMPSASIQGEPSKDLETGVSPATPAAKQAARPATAPKPAAPATSSQDSKPDWSRVGDGGSGSPFASEPSTTRSVRQAPERKSSSSFSRATRGDFSGITGGGGA